MKKKQEKWFTLVELIVVIVILVILSYIAFISLTGYGQKARDSVRLSDMTNIQKVLELSKVDVGYYPQPDDGVPVSYSGSTLWTQGYFGTGALREVRRISEVPTDPLSDEPYIYSVTYDGQEYQLAWAMEWGDALGFSPFVETSHAAFSRSIVRGNYNGAFIGKQISDYLYVFAVPSIVTKIYDDIETSLDVVDAVTEKRFIMNNFSAIAPSHQVEETDSAGTVDFTPTSAADVVVYQGTAQELWSYSGALSVAQKIDTLYSGSELESDETIGNLTSADTSNSSLSDAIVYDIGQRLSGVRSINNYINDIISQTMEDVGKRIESSLTPSNTEGESEGGDEGWSSLLSCVNPFGWSMDDGASITAYQTESVAFGETCTSETRTCSDGTLSGSFVYENCSVDAASACSLPWGGTIADSGTATAYQTESVAFGETCTSETRTCSDGTLSGTYSFDSCSVDAAASCNLPWWGTIAHGATTTAYLESSGETCTSETRTCNNGTLSGTYVNQTCSVSDTTPDAFTFNDPTNQAHSTLLQSNTITVTGITTWVPITVTGEGSPDIRVYRLGSWNTLPLGATSGTVYNGDQVYIRMTSSDQLSDTYSALVTIGGTTDSFDVTTRDYYQGAHGTLVTWTGNSTTNIISTPASDAYNFFKLYDYSDANITFGNQDVTIDGHATWGPNQTIVGWNGNNIIKMARGDNNLTLWNGRNLITTEYGATNNLQVWSGNNTIVTGDHSPSSTINIGGGSNNIRIEDYADNFSIQEFSGNGNNTITIEWHNDTAWAINLNDWNNTVKLAGYGSLANITVGDGDNFINVRHYDAEATISLGTWTNQVDARGDLVTIYTGTAGSVEVVDPDTGNSTTVIWRGWSVNYTKFDAAYSNSDKIDVSQLADITDWTDLQANHLQMNIPVGGFTILSSWGNFVVEDEYGSLDASDFIF